MFRLKGDSKFEAASGKTQVIEYLKLGGTSSALILDNSGRADQTLVLGFAQAHTAVNATFDGNVTLQGDNTKNTIQVSSGTDVSDYKDEQVLSGVISGGKILAKDGVGILSLSGDNTFSGVWKSIMEQLWLVMLMHWVITEILLQ